MEKETLTIKIDKQVSGSLCTKCIVCEEAVLLTQHEEHMLRCGKDVPTKICDKCKNAILYIRSQLFKDKEI